METTYPLRPIGRIHTPFTGQEGTPIQPSTAGGAAGVVELFAPYRPALKDLEGFERICLVYWFDRAREYSPLVKPYRDEVERGVFATRAPSRPNPLGISAVRLIAVEVEKGELLVERIDVLDGTPLLDLKPYIPEFDAYPLSRAGWMDATGSGQGIADSRFQPPD
jgi:tRNA-Thr(GGU) m(6)t(6)A37 methyltransferase TsaA